MEWGLFDFIGGICVLVYEFLSLSLCMCLRGGGRKVFVGVGTSLHLWVVMVSLFLLVSFKNSTKFARSSHEFRTKFARNSYEFRTKFVGKVPRT